VSAEDMILVSVDDHRVEPPRPFEGRLPAKFADHDAYRIKVNRQLVVLPSVDQLVNDTKDPS
jgi:hypothetical protein